MTQVTTQEDTIRIYTKSIESQIVDDALYITGIASTTNPDLSRDIVTPDCLKSLESQAVGLNLYEEHSKAIEEGLYYAEDVRGVITDAKIIGSNLHITAKILPEYATEFKQRLEFGINYGLSIAGKSVRDKNQPNIILDYKLLEISITTMPDNFETYSSVRVIGDAVCTDCLAKAFHYITNDEENPMTKKEEEVIETKEAQLEENNNDTQNTEVEYLTREAAIELFNELMAEKEQTIAEDVVTQVEPQLQNIVNESLEAIETKAKKEDDEEVVTEEDDAESEETEETVETTETTEEEVIEEEDKKTLQIPAEVKNTKASMVQKTNSHKTFLDSETRDLYGRNKKYL